MAHDAPAHHLFAVKFRLAPCHERDGGVGDLEIIRPPRIARRDVRRTEFQVGQVHVDVRIERFQRGARLVGVRVVHDGDARAADAECLDQLRHEVRRGDEVDVLRARLFQFFEHARQFFGRHRFARGGVRKFVVLAEHASQRAPAEKYRSRAVFRRYAGLLKGVEPVFCHDQVIAGAAYAAPRRAVRPACDGAKSARSAHS